LKLFLRYLTSLSQIKIRINHYKCRTVALLILDCLCRNRKEEKILADIKFYRTPGIERNFGNISDFRPIKKPLPLTAAGGMGRLHLACGFARASTPARQNGASSPLLLCSRHNLARPLLPPLRAGTASRCRRSCAVRARASQEAAARSRRLYLGAKGTDSWATPLESLLLPSWGAT
jgi:hypothetical protein